MGGKKVITQNINTKHKILKSGQDLNKNIWTLKLEISSLYLFLQNYFFWSGRYTASFP